MPRLPGKTRQIQLVGDEVLLWALRGTRVPGTQAPVDQGVETIITNKRNY